MLKRIFLATMLVPAVASAQTGTFTITGNIGKLDKPAKVYIDYTSDNGKGGEDSAVLVNGQFKLTGKLVGNASARLALDHEGKGKGFSVYSPGADVIYFYFGAENVKIASKDSLYNATFSGSKVYNEFVAYKKYIGGSIMELSRDYQQAYMEASDEDKRDAEFMQAMNSRFEARRKARAEKVLEFAKNNPKSYFALAGLSELADKGNAAVTKPIWDALSKELKATDMGKELGLRMASINITKVGQPAPAFTQNDVDGKPLALASLKGKVVLIDFWASWCSPCRAENPNMLSQYKIYKDKGFEILSVSLDSDKKAWVKAIEEDKLPWLHVSDLKGWSNEVGRLYGVRGVPTCYLLDKEGNIIATDVRGEKLNEKLKEIFAN